MKSYIEMLNEIYEKLPKKVETIDRYKLPQLEIEYKGNKTIIKNIEKILNFIRRDKKNFKKTFSRILGVQINFEGNELIINANVSKQVIENKINEYVNKFVICEVCQKPETVLEEENNILYLRCLACGYRKILRE